MYAYYCLHKFRWPPGQFANLSLSEKALVIEMIDERIREEKKEQARLKKRR
ncbi:hypothetical protein [Paraclostridium sordellii]|uniref:hypothetical protein n=1 Tax=Paraclostridium sordellii TaxID=1505 RepID=UPI0005DAF5CD|nr:hypothetical protein [Paeniclostridium sordellii]MDU6247303.1 hypothetical protein [Paeniclostridium sordellii]MRZ79667.1 hypothetical protein [Paeniclostridium sordellii]MSB57725.1 hypothetical protein [Paeniclostridium sordellii]MVO70959.1 hypothetical protein [Paeniclostridium sordellii]CEO27159.1 Uncharacterised protein [[Clostridium] sordellii] [Paeniclostridium sordellii]